MCGGCKGAVDTTNCVKLTLLLLLFSRGEPRDDGHVRQLCMPHEQESARESKSSTQQYATLIISTPLRTYDVPRMYCPQCQQQQQQWQQSRMRVKKYKRVKRPKVHAGFPSGSAEKPSGDDAGDAGLLSVGSEVTDRPEESDSNAGEGQETEQQLLLETADHKKRERGKKGLPGKRPSNGSSRGGSSRRNSSALVWPEDSRIAGKDAALSSSMEQEQTAKSGNQSTSDDGHNDMQVQVAGTVDGEDAASSPIDGSINSNAKDNDGPPGTATPRTSRCSEVEANADASGTIPLLKGDGDDEDECEEYEDDELEDSNDDGGTTLTSGRGSLWFKAERIFIFLQLLALVLDVDGAAWPPLFTWMWSWVWLTNQYLRWPLLILLRRVGHGFSLTFGDAKLELWFFRDVIGYGVEVSAFAGAFFVLFFVLQMPDYTSHKANAAWQRSFLTHWFRRTLPRYVFNLALSFAAFAALTYYGDKFFPPDVVTAVIVIGGTLLTVYWLTVVVLSFLIHITLRVATKHDAEYSFMIAMVSSKRGVRVVEERGSRYIHKQQFLESKYNELARSNAVRELALTMLHFLETCEIPSLMFAEWTYFTSDIHNVCTHPPTHPPNDAETRGDDQGSCLSALPSPGVCADHG